ncbi:MAG: adenylosuccinate synthetase [Rhodospirillales bacterium]|nr:adenylosuccinate synthetase [Rhodospirillales bacterium]
MPVTVVVGGQYGSEGKGKVALEFAKAESATVAIRIGGSNSGHTVIDDEGRARAFRHLPTACILPDVTSVIGPGSYIDKAVLLREIEETGLSKERLLIDENAVLITDEHKQYEKDANLRGEIGSTGSGTGAAVISRIMRRVPLAMADSDLDLASVATVTKVRSYLRDRLSREERLIIEGTQGFGLSLLHSDHYPKVTSRDTTAAGFVSEVGLSPLDVDQVVMVLRAFPIRVAGKQSGPLPNEIDWETIARESGSDEILEERTTVTGKVRRVARFHPSVVRAAIEVNSPTHIVMNHLDHVDWSCRANGGLTPRVEDFLKTIEKSIDQTIDMIGIDQLTIHSRIQSMAQ